MIPKRVPFVMVILVFVHFGLSFWQAVRGVLGFPLLYVVNDGIPLESILFANSALWGIAFAALMVVWMSRRRP
jgi:hypothetical protein